MTDQMNDGHHGSEAFSEDVTSEAESVCEEERVRKLFQACDADGDGYIDSQDLLSVCRELNLEDSLEELMRELGADETGRISYAEFLQRRLSLRAEIDALRRQQRRQQRTDREEQPQQKRHIEPEYISSDNSLGDCKHESWEFDSGARDLSPEPASLQKLVEAAGGNTVSSSPTHLLDLANRLHLAALASLKSEVSDLTNRLRAATTDRDMLERSLNNAQLEKLRVSREAEQMMEAQAHRYEERLTELHSVIAELRRKLDVQRSNVIQEDEETEQADEESEDGAASHNQDQTDEQPKFTDSGVQVVPASEVGKPLQDTHSSSSGDIDNRAVEAGESVVQQLLVNQLSKQQNTGECVGQKSVGNLQVDVSRAMAMLSAVRDQPWEQYSKERSIPSSALSPVQQDEAPVLKIAERVKLRRMEQADHFRSQDLDNLELWSTPVAEQLVLLQGLPGESSLQELLCNCLTANASFPCDNIKQDNSTARDGGESSSEERLIQQVAGLQQLLPLREFELEMERERARAEHLRTQCDVLTLALDEARAHTDRLTLLCGKYESNVTALWLALGHSDAALEAYDVLLALNESELVSMMATCRVAGVSVSTNCPAIAALAAEQGLGITRAGELRHTAESVAALLLAKLDRNSDSEDSKRQRNDSGQLVWSPRDETRLRNHIGRLKAERSRIRATSQPGLESIHSVPAPPRTTTSVAESRKLDLEIAVLMQELMAMREERADLRSRCHVLERERAAVELRLSGQEATRQAQGAALNSLQQQLRDSESRLSEPAQSEEGELAQALSREARLKERLQEMMVSLDTVSRSADIRHQQANEMLTEMRRANGTLAVTLEKCKKKYQARMRKLEHQSTVSVEWYSSQVRTLKQRIMSLESEACEPVQGASETSL